MSIIQFVVSKYTRNFDMNYGGLGQGLLRPSRPLTRCNERCVLTILCVLCAAGKESDPIPDAKLGRYCVGWAFVL